MGSVDHILKYWEQAKDHERIEGRTWYSWSLIQIFETMKDAPLTLDQMVWSTVITCNCTPWEKNPQLAADLFWSWELGGRSDEWIEIQPPHNVTLKQRQQLVHLWNHPRPSEFRARGPKCEPFGLCILNDHHPDVPIDAHTFRLWLDDLTLKYNVSTPTKSQTLQAQEDYRTAARMLQKLPTEVQATTWTVARRLGKDARRERDQRN